MKELIPVIDSAGDKYLIATRNIQRVEPLPKDKQTDTHMIMIIVLEPVSAAADGLCVVYEINFYYSSLSMTGFLREHA